MSYTATGLNPYITYFVRVTAINGVGEGYPVNATTMTDQEGIQQFVWYQVKEYLHVLY